MGHSEPCLAIEWVQSQSLVDNGLVEILHLSNVHLVKYVNIIKSANGFYGLVSEFYTINLANFNKFSFKIDLFALIKHILLGLEYLNNCRLSHKYLTLESILLDENNCAKISGVSRSLGQSDRLCLIDNLIYLSPETLVYYNNNNEIHLKNDIWSLGIIILQLLDTNINELLSSLSHINLSYASNIAFTIIYYTFLNISASNGYEYSTIGLDYYSIEPYFVDFNRYFIPKLSKYYNASEISEIKALPLLENLLKFITGHNIINKYYKELSLNNDIAHLKILGICYKCLIISSLNRPSASELLDEFYTALDSDKIIATANLSYSDIFELFLLSNLNLYIPNVPNKRHTMHVYKIKLPRKTAILRNLRRLSTITPIAGIYALTIRPTCGYSRQVSALYTWLRMCRFDHVLYHYNDYKIALAEAKIDFPGSHRLIIYLIALEIVKFNDFEHNLSINTNQIFHLDNFSVNNKLSAKRVSIALDYLLSTQHDVVYYPGLEDICLPLTSITDNQYVINELFVSIVCKYVKPFYLSSFHSVNLLMDKFDSLLRFFDPELYFHISALYFKCNSFLVEWLATLFTRIFSLDKLLLCWDIILVHGNNYEDYILFVALAIIYSCKKYILSATDANGLMKSIKTGLLFIHIPMVTAMGTRLASIYGYLSSNKCKNCTIVDQNSNYSLKMFNSPLEVLSLQEICGTNLHKLHYIKFIGNFDFYEKFLIKYKHPLVMFEKTA